MSTVAVATIVDTLARHRFRYQDEDELQRGLAAVLAREGFEVEREVRLNRRDRIDLIVGRVGVEVKVAGEASSLLRQVTRYVGSDRVDAVLVVTNRVRHLRLPPKINEKPVAVVALAAAGL
jgi:hypothetical protein